MFGLTARSVIVIIAAVALTGLVGSYFASMNRDWYDSISKPSFQPPSWVFGAVWTTLFILAAISILLVLNTNPHNEATHWFVRIAIINGILNILWSAMFFGHRLVHPAIWEAGALCLTVIAMIIIAWQINRVGAVLLVPYALWTAFATYLTRTIWVLNR